MESLEERLHAHTRIPTIQEINKTYEEENMATSDLKRFCQKNNYVIYDNFYKDEIKKNIRRDNSLYTYCFLSVLLSFILGLSIGVILVGSNPKPIDDRAKNSSHEVIMRTLNSISPNAIKTEDNEDHKDRYAAVSFTSEHKKYDKEVYPKGLTEDMKEILKDNKESRHRHKIENVNMTFVPNDNTVLYGDIYWGPEVENAMPQGYGESTSEIWESYVDQSEIIKMELGCGRMQNRLVTFQDGIQACVRYRQNTDQIQGEIFSFYVGRLLNLNNLAPSVVKVVDLKNKLWKSVSNDVATAQWNTNRAVVLTQYIPSLESATIPDIFKPSTRHLNKIDVFEMSAKENVTTEESKQVLLKKLRSKTVKKIQENVDNFNHIDMKLSKNTINNFLELAQWSDLIIFDYLTANLDRIVNNLFNYQWNINIMDGPAHNLARKMDSGLLLFLDNESGLLHGYRLLKKYDVYHSLMLDNLCVFRKRTIDSLKNLFESQSVGSKLSKMFHKKNNAVIRDILPPLPEKNAKILHERIGRVLTQVDKCVTTFR